MPALHVDESPPRDRGSEPNRPHAIYFADEALPAPHTDESLPLG